jgi:hypothetical protein
MSAALPETREEVLAYARNYWQHGNEPVTQRVLGWLAQLVHQLEEERRLEYVVADIDDPGPFDGMQRLTRDEAIDEARRRTELTAGTIYYVAKVRAVTEWQEATP